MENLQAGSEPGPEARIARRIADATPGVGRAAETELYRLLAPRVRRYGLRHLRDPHAAADLVQHVMMLTIERLRARRVREPERVLSFVLSTCRMTVMNQRRTEWRRENLLERYADAFTSDDAPIVPREDHTKVADCLERLPERERSVLIMTFYDEASSETVAAQLGLSAGNVRVIRHRAIEKLRRCVDSGRRVA